MFFGVYLIRTNYFSVQPSEHMKLVNPSCQDPQVVQVVKLPFIRKWPHCCLNAVQLLPVPSEYSPALQLNARHAQYFVKPLKTNRQVETTQKFIFFFKTCTVIKFGLGHKELN